MAAGRYENSGQQLSSSRLDLITWKIFPRKHLLDIMEKETPKVLGGKLFVGFTTSQGGSCFWTFDGIAIVKQVA